MKWEKLGLLYEFTDVHPRLKSHASNPLAVHLRADEFRVYFSSRDRNNKSSVGWVDLNIRTKSILEVGNEPLISYGSMDSFYSHGISIGNLYKGPNHQQYILFMAWQIRGKEHWRGDIGRLELKDNGSLEISPDRPFISTDQEDEISLSYPHVEFHEGIYKMWYGSTIDWKSENGEMIHVIKYATSKDAEKWVKHGVAIPYELGIAQAFSRPTVIIDESGYHMWYSYRDGTDRKYRIGYSTSDNGLEWTNHLDKAGITVSEKGWDSEMICYPFVFEHKGELYMLYNGNDYGRCGFGIAKLIK
jgi:hypothetical protein